MTIDKEKFKIEHDKDDEMSVLSLSQHLEDDSNRKKNLFAQEFEMRGESFINEIEKKKRNKDIMQQKLIPFILKRCNGFYDKEELISYCFEDVQEIYNRIKANKTKFQKFIQFLFNLD